MPVIIAGTIDKSGNADISIALGVITAEFDGKKK